MQSANRFADEWLKTYGPDITEILNDIYNRIVLFRSLLLSIHIKLSLEIENTIMQCNFGP